MITDQKIIDTARMILMHSFESVNGVNCYGITPNKNSSIEYKKAIKKALKITEAMHPAIHNYLLENYA